MNLQGTVQVKAPRDRVWEALNDANVLEQCTPGCKQMTRTEDGSYDVLLEVGIASVKGRYTGKIRISDRIPGTQYKLAVTEKSAPGFLNAEGILRLEEQGEETRIEYSGQANVGGLIAGVGQRIMGGVAKQLVRQFFQSFERLVVQSAEGGS